MRVTSGSMYLSMSSSLATSLSRVSDLQSQVSSGQRINKISDDPVGAATALRYRSLEADQTAYEASADNANTWLGTADTSLQSMSTSLRRVRELAVSAGNGSLTPEARKAISDELLQLRDELADTANTQQDSQALFGGFAKTAVTRADDGTWSYTGDSGQVQRKVAAGVTLQANVDGRTAFGFDQPAGKDLLSVIDNLASHALSGDQTALITDQGDLQDRTNGVLGALGTVGASMNRVDAATSRGKQFVDQLTTERGQIEGIDYAQAILQLSSAQLGYQAALGAAAKANLPSLADFLR